MNSGDTPVLVASGLGWLEGPDPSYIFALAPDGSPSLLVDFPEPVFPNGVAVEGGGSIVWDKSYTGRPRPDGSREDLGRMPGGGAPTHHGTIGKD